MLAIVWKLSILFGWFTKQLITPFDVDNYYDFNDDDDDDDIVGDSGDEYEVGELEPVFGQNTQDLVTHGCHHPLIYQDQNGKDDDGGAGDDDGDRDDDDDDDQNVVD